MHIQQTQPQTSASRGYMEALESMMSPDRYRRNLDIREKEGIWYFGLGTASTEDGMNWSIRNAIAGFKANASSIDWC